MVKLSRQVPYFVSRSSYANPYFVGLQMKARVGYVLFTLFKTVKFLEVV